jgi:ABC-type multidrug transport system ATPase subunit
MYAVETHKLSKSFDGLAVLQGVDLHVPEGAVYGLIGPSNAGKSTLIRLLMGFLRKDGGMLRVLGSADPEQVRGRVGYAPQGAPFPAGTGVREYLRFLGRCGGLAGPQLEAQIDDALQIVGLASEAGRAIDKLPRPEAQRLGIAQALVGKPLLLLFDEVTSGAESGVQHELLDVIAEVRSRGQTILLATPFLEEAEYLCDSIGILYGGRIAAESPMSALRGPGRNALISVAELPAALALRLQQLSPAVECGQQEVALHPSTPELQSQVLRLLLDAGVTIISLEPFGRPLEDLYRRIVRGELPQPDAAGQAEERVTRPLEVADTLLEQPHDGPTQAVRRPGDTLLRDLLQREEHHEQ